MPQLYRIDYAAFAHNPKVNIYARTSAVILEKCFEQAEAYIEKYPKEPVPKSKAKPTLIAAVMDQAFYKNIITNDFIRTKSRETMEALASAEMYPTVNFDHEYLYTLCIFAGIPDGNYELFNNDFGPVHQRLITFSSRPFRLFEFIRVGKSGMLSESSGSFSIECFNQRISGVVKRVQAFTMPGDRDPLWILIHYTDSENKERPLYITDVKPGPLAAVSDSDYLLSFFQRLSHLA